MFDLPPTSEGAEGLTDTTPVKIQGVSAFEFEQLIWVLITPFVARLVGLMLDDHRMDSHACSGHHSEYSSMRLLDHSTLQDGRPSYI